MPSEVQPGAATGLWAEAESIEEIASIKQVDNCRINCRTFICEFEP